MPVYEICVKSTSIVRKLLALRCASAVRLRLLSILPAMLAFSGLIVPLPSLAQNISLPPGFSETAIATDIQNPVGMEVSPDGRLFVLAGNIRRIEVFDDTGFVNEFIRLPQARNLGSGLLGLEFAPDFETSGDVYIAYITDPVDIPGPQRFRLSRFSSDGTVADVSSEVVLFEVVDVDPLQQQHQGGDLVIGADGKIYWALGDRVEGSTVSQPMDSLFGKLLRLNTDGSIPTDNPFYNELQGGFRAIYANGLRNPFRMDKRLSTGDIYMSEVGNFDWEEVNLVEAGANYGWPVVEGPANDPRFTDPVHAYPHDPDGCAIMGGSFYEPEVDQFPAVYHDKYFYADHCFGWIAYVDVDTGTDVRFMTGGTRLVEVKISPVTGALYYLDREYLGDDDGRKGGIGRIDYSGGALSLEITRQPASVTAAVGESVNFNVLVTGQSPIEFQWFRDGQPLPGETTSTLTVADVQSSDDLSPFFVQVTDANGSVLESDVAVLSVSANTAPVPTITLPLTDQFYIAGQQYRFAGIASDAEDGALGSSAFDWEVIFHHDDHVHPFITDAPGIRQGTFIPPVNDETSPNVWYRIHLTVTDSAGTSTSVQRDLFPLITGVAVETDPPGLEILLDGSPDSTPIAFQGVAGVARVLEAPQTQVVGGQTYSFSSWSNDGSRTQTISTPLFDTLYVASYELQSEPEPPEPPVTQVEFASGSVDSDRVVAQRWVRVPFEPLISGTHTIRVLWDNDAELRFSVFEITNTPNPGDRVRIGSTLNTDTPGEWSGTLDISGEYYLGVWSTAGAADFTATIEAGGGGVTPLEITTQPADQNVTAGEEVNFVVDAQGSGALSYQWAFNGVDIPGATSSVLTLASSTLDNAGTYSVTVSDSVTTISASAVLTVTDNLAVTIGEGSLAADGVTAPRWTSISFVPLTTATHTLTASWNSDADVLFNVRRADGTRVTENTVRGSNPGVWQGELDANEEYFVGIWSRNGLADYTVTLEAIVTNN